MFEKISSTLKTANDALADAQKSWRDNDLTEREKRIVEKEADLTRREADLKKRIDALGRDRAKRWLLKVLVAVVMIAVAVGAFYAGGIVALTPSGPTSLERTSQPRPNAVAVSNPSTVSAPSKEALADQSRVPTFRECVTKGDAYFLEIGAWPNLRTTGQDAHEAVVERCGRSRYAFGS